MDLPQWQDRLAQHFMQLRVERATGGSDQPLFALEHGLDESEVNSLAAAIHAQIARGAPQRDCVLPWIVYATEIGYRYAGDQYWQTFESDTRGWLDHGDRYWIRDCFRAFRTQFNGAEPSGPWAEQFSIICWPITHAILPRDLQRQLAMLLYELRHTFSAELFESPAKLGEIIAANSWNATSRFRNLAQETQLVGQIAAALLLQGEFGSDGLILPATLRRIGADLDRERRARDWLRGARRFAEERARVRGLALGHRPVSCLAPSNEEARAEVVALGIEPRLVLRPTTRSDESWEITLEIPDLSHLLLKFPQLGEILTGSRCVVAGAAGRPLARGRLLHGAQRVALVSWPRSDEVLLHFEQSDPQLDYLLRTECLLRPGATRLFRVASDGLAYELRSMRVRPGEKYVIVSSSGPLRVGAHARAVVLTCEGVQGATIELPDAIDGEWEEELRTLGLGQAKTIEVWPAGLSAFVWDGEGHGEWLASERPCFAICTDHHIDALLVSLIGSEEDFIEITPIKPGAPIFVELPHLPVGLHTVRVSARGGPESEAEQIGDLNVVMRIREARPWVAGVSPHGPLFVQMDPLVPTLEQLWEGRAEVTVRGPTGRNIKCRAALFEKEDGAAIVVKHLPPIELPVTPHGWRTHFERHFRNAKDTQGSYDSARACELQFSADELGAFTVRCEREFTPLRWGVRRRGQEHVLQLVDDSGGHEPPSVARLAFETPNIEEPLALAQKYKVPPAGGLYVSRMGQFSAAIIAPPAGRGLADLGCTPRLDVREHSMDSVVHLLELSRLWGHARIPGDIFSATRRHHVLRAIAQEVFRVLGGNTWFKAEVAIRDGRGEIAALKREVSKRQEERAVGVAIWRDCERLATADRQVCVERLAELGTRFLSLPWASTPPISYGNVIVRRSKSIADDLKWLAEFALRLASDPSGAENWAGPGLCDGTRYLFNIPTFARAARFLVLATDHHLQSNVATGELYAGWDWK